VEISDLERVLDWRNYPSSAWMLIGSNILAPLAAVILGAGPASIVWAYWLESVVIGVFTILTLLTMAMRALASQMPGFALSATGVAAFFCVHYGMFHGGYALFLYILPWFTPEAADIAGIGLAALMLSASHGFSFLKNVLGNSAEMENTRDNLMRVMNAPYGRIIPMHIAIIASGFIMIPLAPALMVADAAGEPAGAAVAWASRFAAMSLLMALKTAADLYGHLSRYRKS
jgi:hypothetical protein